MKSGFVSVIGRPNVGKSTLINTIVNEKIAITSDKSSTTRNLIQGIYTSGDTQIVFVDTPGIHKPINKLDNRLNFSAYKSIEDTDAVLLVMDASTPLGKGDAFVLEKLSHIKKPIILVLNKIDKLSNEEILKKIDEVKDLYNFSEIIPLSALKNDNVERLLKVLSNYLTDNVKYYPKEEVTSSSIEFRLSEIVREKILELTNDEVPHSVTCYVNDLTKDDVTTNVYIDIIVDRESLKKIIIGKGGDMLKEIGTRARSDMEKLLNTHVYLELYVKVLKKWRDKDKLLNELGFNE